MQNPRKSQKLKKTNLLDTSWTQHWSTLEVACAQLGRSFHWNRSTLTTQSRYRIELRHVWPSDSSMVGGSSFSSDMARTNVSWPGRSRKCASKNGSVMDSDLRSKCSWKVLAQESQSNFARKTSKELLRWIPFVKFPPKAYHQLVHLPDHLQNTPQTPSVHSCRVDPPPQPLRCAAARWAIPFLVILLSLLAPLLVPYGTCQVGQVIQVITARWCGGTWLESCQSCWRKHRVVVGFCQQTDCYNILTYPDHEMVSVASRCSQMMRFSLNQDEWTFASSQRANKCTMLTFFWCGLGEFLDVSRCWHQVLAALASSNTNYIEL